MTTDRLDDETLRGTPQPFNRDIHLLRAVNHQTGCAAAAAGDSGGDDLISVNEHQSCSLPEIEQEVADDNAPRSSLEQGSLPAAIRRTSGRVLVG